MGAFSGDGFRMDEIHRFPHEGVSFFLADRSGAVSERTYWDDILLYRNLTAGLAIYRREVSDTLDSIGIDTWGADGQIANEDGEMLGKIYCYRDHRLDGMTDKIKARIDPRRMYRITGIHFQPFNVSNQLHWLVLNRHDLLRPGCFYLPVPSVFAYCLGGVRSVDSSWASVTQLMDAQTRQWSGEILKALDIPRAIMPEIVAPGTVVGRLTGALADSIGLNRAALVAVGSHDTASAFAAAPVDDVDRALIISSGTWSLVGRLIPEPITSQAAMDANISNEGGIGNIRFLKNCMGTWPAQELRRAWAAADGKEMTWEEMTALAETAPPFGSFVDPDDKAFYNPASMEAAVMQFCARTGQAVPANRGAMLRLVYESLALKYRMVNDQICAVSGTRTAKVHIVGGGSRNALLNQFTADALALPVLAGPEEATAIGNLMVQAAGLGVVPSLQAAMPMIRSSFPIAEYKPRDADAWREAYARFRGIVQDS